MVELWLVDVEAAGPALEALEADTPRLSDDDHTRAGRLADPRERRHRLVVYSALRIALERSGGPGLRRQPFVRSDAGKPRLSPSAPAFSIAHIAGLALIGVARSPTIGVDLESARVLRMSPRRQQETLAVGAGLCLHDGLDAPGEVDVLQAWCRLEAFGKATGKGISGVLGELGLRAARGRDLSFAQIRAAARELARAERLSIADLGLRAGLYGAVASAGPLAAPQVAQFPADPQSIARLVSEPAG